MKPGGDTGSEPVLRIVLPVHSRSAGGYRNDDPLDKARRYAQATLVGHKSARYKNDLFTERPINSALNAINACDQRNLVVHSRFYLQSTA